MAPQVIYADQDLMIVDKPDGLLSVPGRTVDKQDCAYARLRAEYPEILVVHRLDRDTSGVMVFARTRQAQSELSQLFAKGSVEKEYVAWVDGRVIGDAGQINAAIGRMPQSSLPPRYQIDEEQGRPATTHWSVLERTSHRTRLRLQPKTGRSHQLRVHLSHLGHPILGDPIYGSPESRMYLHAHRLSFVHPRLGAMLEVTACLPF